MSLPFSKTFSGRSVFVTGHTGFKGSWMCLWFKHLGAEVTGYALEPPTNPNNFTISEVQNLLVKHYQADIRNQEMLHRAMIEAEPDFVFHLAAQSVVNLGYQLPFETYEVNTLGTASVLEGVRKLKKPCVVVIVTSDKCYENREQVWGFRESDPFGDNDPYGGSKGAAEIVVRSYRHSYFHPDQLARHQIKLASARAGNVIGGGDWTSDALVVDLVRAITQGQSVRLRQPEACRPWQHVLQALSGYLMLASRLAESDLPELCSGWNIGPLPGNELPVWKVAEIFFNEWGRGSWENAMDPNTKREAQVLRLCIDKALWKLGWRPGWGISESLEKTAHWYKQYLNKPGSMQELCFAQIGQYEETLESVLP